MICSLTDFVQDHQLPFRNPSSEYLAQNTSVLLLDRTASPSGSRRLKDIRLSRPHAWPNPSTYTVPELAKRLLKEQLKKNPQQAHLQHLALRETKDDIFLIHTFLDWAQQSSPTILEKLTPLKLLEIMNLAKTLDRFHLAAPDAVDFIRQIETERSSPEYSDWTLALLFYTGIKSKEEEFKFWFSEWSLVSALLQTTSATAVEHHLNLTEVLGLAPQSEKPLIIYIPTYCDPYPLEKLWVEWMQKLFSAQLKIKWLFPANQQQNKDIFKSFKGIIDSLSTKQIIENPKTSALIWGFQSVLPGPAEVLSRVSGDFPIDCTTKEKNPEFHTLASHLNLWADYHENNPSPSHGIFQNPQAPLFLKTIDLDLNSELEQKQNLQRLFHFFSQTHSTWENLAELCTKSLTKNWLRLGDWVQVFIKTSEKHFATSSPQLLSHPRLSAQGLGIYTLADIPFLGMENLYLWTTKEECLELLNPESEFTLKKKLFPTKLEALFFSKGLAAPNPSYEANLLIRLLLECHHQLVIFDEASTNSHDLLKPKPKPSFETRIPSPQKLSASQIELYTSCPQRYYWQRLLKTKSIDEWDPETPSALKRGLWIHKSLELFFKNPQWEQSAHFFETTLVSLIETYFTERVSANYKAYLASLAKKESQLLAQHIEGFEYPLYQQFPELQHQCEKPFEFPYLNRTFRGVFDRVDTINQQNVLLWDYKTGRVCPSSKPTTMISSHAKSQWFFYNETMANVQGGGYLNPLDPSKSILFVFEDSNESILNFLMYQQKAHSVSLISNKEKNEIRELIKHTFEEAIDGIANNQFAPNPIQESLCKSCHFQNACGKPFFEQSAEANGELS